MKMYTWRLNNARNLCLAKCVFSQNNKHLWEKLNNYNKITHHTTSSKCFHPLATLKKVLKTKDSILFVHFMWYTCLIAC